MNCPKCGKALPDNAVFCSGCGNSVEPETETDKLAAMLPPVPPSFSRAVSRSGRRPKERTGSKGTGCLVASLIFFIICAVIAAFLLFGSGAQNAAKDNTCVSTPSGSITETINPTAVQNGSTKKTTPTEVFK